MAPAVGPEEFEESPDELKERFDQEYQQRLHNFELFNNTFPLVSTNGFVVQQYDAAAFSFHGEAVVEIRTKE